MIIECAVKGRAEVIVTPMGKPPPQAHDRFGILVFTPAAFLTRCGRRGLGKRGDGEASSLTDEMRLSRIGGRACQCSQQGPGLL
jgi:hypothetical protein